MAGEVVSLLIMTLSVLALLWFTARRQEKIKRMRRKCWR